MLRGLTRLSARNLAQSSPALRRGLPRNYASAVTDLRSLPQPGDKLHGFTVKRSKSVPELELAAIQLEHDATGADYIHVAREDKNNVFAVGFKTNPNDDTGVPHILEHTTLCGSEKYPVRDPFFKMLNRSLSNFMNAFTSGDHTTYPFATTNRVDFYNLMDVYMDATFKPLLKESDFKQEGWRLGPEDPKDPKSPLLFKGVVYNEMKGQMSDSSYLYYIRFQDHIVPDLHNSGGDPPKITDLTLEQLRQFHKNHYNPSNSRIFTYGDMPLGDHLARINEKFANMSRANVDSDLRVPITLTKNESVVEKGPVDPMMDKDAQHKTSVSWIMNDTSDVVETFSIRILSSYLLDGYGSAMYQGLIDGKLGSDFSPNTYYDTSSKKAIWSVGLQNVRAEDVPKVHQKIHTILQEVHDKGFDQRKIDGILHQLELGLKHKTANFGMSVMNGLMPPWFNGVDPFDALSWEATVSEFKKRYVKGGYLESLMEKYLLDKNTFTFTMEPDTGFGESLKQEEATRLAREIKKVGGEASARDGLVKQEQELLETQERARHESLDCLPTLKVADIPRQMERKPLVHGDIDGVPTQWRIAPTNGLTYFRAVIPLNDLPENLRVYLPLFTEAIMRLGTAKKSMEEIEDEIKLKTGGIRTGTHISTNHSNLEVAEEGLVLSGYSLDNNVPDMLELLRTVLQETNYKAVAQMGTLVQGIASGFVNSLAESGHSFARTYAAAHLTPAGKASELMGGMTQVKMITQLAASAMYEEALKSIEEISHFVTRRNNLRIAVTCGHDAQSSNESAITRFLSSFSANEPSPSSGSASKVLTLSPSPSLFVLPYQVSYAAMCLKTVPYTHSDGPALQILSQLLTHKHLHHEIREKGGAYGGGAFHRGAGGVFGYYSYRDPNIPNTIRIMKEAGEWAVNREWKPSDIEEAKLSVFQNVDAPTSVSEEGMTQFLDGITEDMRQTRREQLLDVDAAAIKAVAQRYLIDQISKNQAATAVLGEKTPFYDEKTWKIMPVSVDLGTAVDAAEGTQE